MFKLVEEFSEKESLKIAAEFERLKGTHYMDHAGTALYAKSQIKAIQESLCSNFYSNPHTSKITEDLVDQVRFKILSHFNTTSKDYTVIFTSGATGSLKTVAECFDFSKNGSFLYTKDCHTSVLGMREVVLTENVKYVLKDQLIDGKSSKEETSLLVFPAQCNFNGTKYPLSVIQGIQENGLQSYPKDDIYVCLDAAGYVSTNHLDLEKYQPDFVTISFYKIFGYPTGLGALLVSRRGEGKLVKRYYGGGTVKIAFSSNKWHVKRDSLHLRFEDGTISFLSIISLLHGFATLDRLIPGSNPIERIGRHVFNLGKYLYNLLDSLEHKNGQKAVKLYHATNFDSIENQGGIVNMNVLKDDGNYIGYAEFLHMAQLQNIVIRTGCFCNSGACQQFLGHTDEMLKHNFNAGHVCGDHNDLIDGHPTGSIRVSFGYMTTKEDVDALYNMIVDCYIKTGSTSNLISERKPQKKLKGIHLRSIIIYPIKSCGAFEITTKWSLTEKGLKYDREWMIVNDDGLAMTQKKEPRMCLIKPKILDNQMILSFPEMEQIAISLNYKKNGIIQPSKICQSKVCRDNVTGIDCGDEIADWISLALNTSGLRLIRQCENDERTISLSNQAQFLLINKTSVEWLAQKVIDYEENIDRFIARFRGNLIIETENPLEEMEWKGLRVGQIRFTVDGPCSRCQMICIDQYSGFKTSEPLKTIAKEFNGKMKFGIYLSQDKNNVNCSIATMSNYIDCDNFIQEMYE